jgi:putative DNA primase/helicase
MASFKSMDGAAQSQGRPSDFVQRLMTLEESQWEDTTDPFGLAKTFLNHLRIVDGLPVLQLWKDRWWYWQDGYYTEWKESRVKDEVTGSIKREFDRIAGSMGRHQTAPHVTSGMVTNTIQALRSLVLLPDETEQPGWIDGKDHPPAEGFLVCRNGLVHIPTFRDGGSDYLVPHTPAFFSTNALAFDFDSEAPEPKEWLNFLGAVFPQDHDNIRLLQEWAGYCLTPDTGFQKILMLVGPPRAGKGTICRILEELIGRRNVGASSLNGMGKDFGLQGMIGKSLVIFPDVRVSGRTDMTSTAERLLTISGGDGVEVNAKYAIPVTMRLATKFMLVTNKLPDFQDATIVNRFLILQFTKSWLGKEDIHLERRLRAELPGILLWALEGLKRLRQQGKFTVPAAGEATREKLAVVNSTVAKFVQDWCEVGPEFTVAATPLFDKYQKWWLLNVDAEPPKNSRQFVKDLFETVPTLEAKVVKINGVATRGYVGLRCPVALDDKGLPRRI